MSANTSLNRSHSVSFEQQPWVQGQALQQAYGQAQAHAQAQAHRPPPQLHGQGFAPALGSTPLGSMPLGQSGAFRLLDPPQPLGSAYSPCLDGSFAASPIGCGTRGLQSPFHSPPHHQLSMAGTLPMPSGLGMPPRGMLQPPMSPLGMLGGCCPPSGGLLSPPIGLWNQR